MNELTAILGFLSAIIGLFAAYVGRNKKIEYIHTVNRPYQKETRLRTPSFKKRWYDYWIVIAATMILFFPLGFYALYQSRTVSKFWKCFWFLLFAFFLAAAMDN